MHSDDALGVAAKAYTALGLAMLIGLIVAVCVA